MASPRRRREAMCNMPSGKRRRIRVGGLEELAQNAELPDGFESLDNIARWPDYSFEIFLEGAGEYKEQAKSNLATLANRTMYSYSFYSGKGSDGTIACYVNRLLQKHGLCAPGKKAITCCHAVELNPYCIEVLCNMKYGEEWVYDHVFGAFQDRFDASVCNHLKALEEAAGDVAAARVEAYCEMRDYLRSLSEESFRPKPPVMWCHHCKKLRDIKDPRLKDIRKQNGQCFLSFKKLQT